MRQIIPYMPELVARAREHRRNPTVSEALLWTRLKGRQVEGIDFHRQKPLLYWIVDFYAPDVGLAIEVDGPYHKYRREKDAIRQEILADWGVKMLRFTDEDVMLDCEAVVERIRQCLKRRRTRRGLDLS